MQQARTAIREGRLVEARRLLRQVIHEDPTNHAAWLLLAQATPDEKLAAEYIERARLLQPESPLVKRAGDKLAAGKRTGSLRRHFSWRLALPLIGIALILGLLASKINQDAWQQLFALQDNDAEPVLAAANAKKYESRTALQSSAKAITDATPVEGVESAPKAAPASSLEAIIDTEAASSDREKGITFQPVIIAGAEKALPDAIIKGIETSVSSSSEEDIVTENETIAASDTNDATNEEAVKESTGETEIVDDIDAGEVEETAVDDQVVVVEEVESEVTVEEVESEVTVEEEIVSYDSAVPASGERWIDVNLTTQLLTAYEGQTPVLYSAISSGLWQFPTITGEFHTWIKYESQDMTGYHLGYNYELEDVPHVMYFFEDYAIHGAYWHNNFGTPMSHGCVNMNLYDAEWLYNWAPLGTRVSVHH